MYLQESVLSRRFCWKSFHDISASSRLTKVVKVKET